LVHCATQIGKSASMHNCPFSNQVELQLFIFLDLFTYVRV
jgi:hypothetical protein